MALVLLDLTEAKTVSLSGKRTMNPQNMAAMIGGASGGFMASKIGRLTADWSTVRRSADQDLQYDLPKLRARARERQLNSPIAAKFLQMLRTNLIGQHGIRINFKLQKQRQRDGAEKLDEQSNQALHKAWRKWCRKEYCTVHGKYTFKQVCNLMAEAIGRDGDWIVRKVYTSNKDNPFGFSLQLIEPDQLNDAMNRIGDAASPQIRMGVEVDPYQKPLAYHIYAGNPFEMGMGSANCQRVPAQYVYHSFIPRRVGQTRGYPLLAPVLWDTNMLDKYFDAELTAARAGAQLFGTIEQDKGDVGYEGSDGENPDGTVRLEVGNGELAVLAPGQKLNNATPQHPTVAFAPFVERSLRLIASGLGIAYHELGNDLAGVNFSSGRLGILEERDYWMELQNFIIDTFVRPVYEDWVRMACLNGAVPGVDFDMDRLTDEEFIEFMPRRWSWVDPLKDVQASVDEVQNGFATHEEKLHHQGKDWRHVFRQLKVEQDLADELGIQLGTDIRGDALSEVNDGPPDAAGASGGKPTKPVPAPKAGKKSRTSMLRRLLALMDEDE